MNIEILEKAFSELINIRGIHHKLQVKNNYVHQLRFKLKKGIHVSLDVKLRLLQKSGWRQDDKIYNRKDLVSIINFWKRSGKAARAMGTEYVIDKWHQKE